MPQVHSWMSPVWFTLSTQKGSGQFYNLATVNQTIIIVIIIKCLANWRGQSRFSTTHDLQQHVSVDVLTLLHAMTKGCQDYSLLVFLCPSFRRSFQLSHVLVSLFS
ncbi:hypothetical protein BsWGS_23521 [Bradybaena similaris]